jgi:hypothetical protein
MQGRARIDAEGKGIENSQQRGRKGTLHNRQSCTSTPVAPHAYLPTVCTGIWCPVYVLPLGVHTPCQATCLAHVRMHTCVQTLRVRRVYDPERRTLIYVAYSTRLSGDSVSAGRYKCVGCRLALAWFVQGGKLKLGRHPPAYLPEPAEGCGCACVLLSGDITSRICCFVEPVEPPSPPYLALLPNDMCRNHSVRRRLPHPSFHSKCPSGGDGSCAL